MFKEKSEKKRLPELSVSGTRVRDSQDSANGRTFPPPPHPLHALCSSCFSQEGGLLDSPLAISVWIIWSEPHRLKHEEARFSVTASVDKLPWFLKEPHLIFTEWFAAQQKPGRAKLRCLQRSVSVNYVFHMCRHISLHVGYKAEKTTEWKF